VWGMVSLIRSISYEILNRTKLSTDILLRFSDSGLNKEQYASISEQLEDFKLEVDSEYSITLDTKYDETKKILLIRLILSIPDIYKPEEMDVEQIINKHVYRFKQFYERISDFTPKQNKRGL
jgi:hypothetical protein